METRNKVGLVVAILVFAFGMGWYLSNGCLEYDKVEIVPAVDAVYELVPLTPTQAFGMWLSAVAFSTMGALLLGVLATGFAKDM